MIRGETVIAGSKAFHAAYNAESIQSSYVVINYAKKPKLIIASSDQNFLQSGAKNDGSDVTIASPDCPYVYCVKYISGTNSDVSHTFMTKLDGAAYINNAEALLPVPKNINYYYTLFY